MADFKNNFTDELRDALSILDVVGKRVPLNKKGPNYWGCCPFHAEKTPSFSVNEEKGFYHCFGCGEHGDIISFTMKNGNMDFKTAITELAQMAGLKMPNYTPKSQEQVKREETQIEISDNAAKIYQQKLYDVDGEHALSYIRLRGFTDDMIKKYRIGYAPKSNTISNKFGNLKSDNLIATGLVRSGDYGNYDFFRDKLMFPIMNPNGQIIAFSGRSMDGTEPKYINTSDTELFHKRKTIFGLCFARDAIHRNNRTIVVEGQIDAIQMQCNGFEETVAPLGTALTEDHIAILCKLNRNITFCFDGDSAGAKAAARALSIVMPLIRDNSDIKFAFMPAKSDPDDILKRTDGKNVMKKIIAAAIPLVDFLWDLTNKRFAVITPGGRVMATKFIDDTVAKITDEQLKSEMKNEYDNRKFNSWHKWKKVSKTPVIDMPDIDISAKKTLSQIAAKFPEIIEKHSEFFIKIGTVFNNDYSSENTNITGEMAERFVVSMKLQFYLKTLNAEKKDLSGRALSGEAQANIRLHEVNTEIQKILSNIQKLTEL